MSRYIDADKLQEEFKELHGGKRSLLIDTEQTAEVRENVRGVWIDAQYPFSKCSICDCYFDTANNEANFCPNCGAQMIGDKE